MPQSRLPSAMFTALLVTVVVLPATSAMAASPSVPTLAVTDSAGEPAITVAQEETLTSTISAPISLTGQREQRIEGTWNPDEASVDVSSIVTPEGWDLEFTGDGTTWSPSAPADVSTISGVRTHGQVDSDGLSDGGLQVSSTSGTGTLQTSGGGFSGSGGGDGWDAFADETRVFNVFHHNNGRYNLDCHLKSTGASCGAVYGVDGYTTPMMSTGTIADGNVYSQVESNETGEIGMLCTDVSTSPFTSCGFSALTGGGIGDYGDMGSQSSFGTRVYSTTRMNGGQLLCFDVATSAPCAGQPFTLPGFANTLSYNGVHASVVGPRIYVMANKVWCYDAATMAACSGSWPVGDFAGQGHPPVPTRDTSGAITGSCVLVPLTCYDLDGTGVATPSGLAAAVADRPIGGAASDLGIAIYDYTATRQFWFQHGWGGDNPVGCYDWRTQAACADFDTDRGTGAVRYALTVDDTNPNCVWTNGDNGVITSFEPSSGEAGCASADPTVVVPYDAVMPRMPCADTGRVRAFRDLTLTAPAGVDVTALRVTVRDSDGGAVAGFVDLSPDGSGVVDLSELEVADTGTQPSIAITSPNTSTVDATAIVATLRIESDAPQLCFDLQTTQDCPTLSEGISATSALPLSDLVLAGTTVADPNGANVSTALSATIDRADVTGCLGTVQGTVRNSIGIPLGGVALQLLGPDSTLLASTTTATDGTYSFGAGLVNPGSYTVRLAGNTTATTVVAGETSVVDFALDPPPATPLTSSGVGTTQQAATATIPAGGSITLIDGVSSGSVTSVTVTGEGTFTLDPETGVITFDPVLGFSGEATAVGYRVTDAASLSAESTYTPTVELPEAPATDDLTSTGVGTASQTVTVTVPADATVTLLDGETTVTTLTVADEGTYTLDAATGRITFAPLLGFTGPATPVTYRVTDAYGQQDDSTYTPTVTAPAPPSAPDLASVGTGTTAQSVTVTVPPDATIALLDGTTLVDRIEVDGGVYTVSRTTGRITFQPELGFAGEPQPVTYQLSDAYGQVSSGQYRPQVLAPAPPAVQNETTTAAVGESQSITVTVPPGGEVHLLDADGNQSDTVTIPGQGVYTLDPATGVISFSHAAGFTGRADPVSFTVEDAYGQVTVSEYRAQVTAGTTIAPPPSVAVNPGVSQPAGTTPARARSRSSSLARTGADGLWQTGVLGLGLLAGGGYLVLSSRRRAARR